MNNIIATVIYQEPSISPSDEDVKELIIELTEERLCAFAEEIACELHGIGWKWIEDVNVTIKK